MRRRGLRLRSRKGQTRSIRSPSGRGRYDVEQPLPAERHRRIHELLRQERVVRVSALSEQLGVSEVTILRDLEVL